MRRSVLSFLLHVVTAAAMSVVVGNVPMRVVVDRGPFRYRYALYGGSSGGVNSATFVQLQQMKLSPDDNEQLVSQFSVLLDAGGLAIPPEAIDSGDELIVLVSHTHADHVSGLPALCAARDLGGRKTRVLLPGTDGAAERVRQSIACSELLNDPNGGLRYQVTLQPVETAEPPDDARIDEPAAEGAVDETAIGVASEQTPPSPSTSSALADALAYGGGTILSAAALGEAIAAGPSRFLIPFPTVHRVPSCGFTIVQRKQKLRAQHTVDEAGRPLGKPELGRKVKALKATLPSEAIFETEEIVELAYTGDTTADFFASAASARALRAQLLITEATFLCDGVPPEEAPKRGHMHLEQVVSAAAAGQLDGVGKLLLTHFSRRYSVAQIEAALAARLPAGLRERTSALLLAGFHRSGEASEEGGEREGKADAALARSDSF